MAEAHEAMSQCQESTARLVNQLRTLVPKADNLHTCVEMVISDYRQRIHDVDNLNNLFEAFITVLKERTPQNQTEKGSWLTSWFTTSAVKVKVFPVVAAKTFGADTEILKKVNVEVCQHPADCDVVVVFCPVTCRVGSDVDDAMRNIPAEACGKRVILLVMHHLRKDISPAEAQQNHGHQNVIHVVYHETKNGLIKCDTNDRAIETLQEWCKAFTA